MRAKMTFLWMSDLLLKIQNMLIFSSTHQSLFLLIDLKCLQYVVDTLYNSLFLNVNAFLLEYLRDARCKK